MDASPGAGGRGETRAWEVVLALLVVDAVFLVALHALGTGLAYDFGIYYRGGAAAWATGRPALAAGWVGTPFAAAVLAPITRVTRLADAAQLLTIVNLGIVAAGAVAVWRAVRTRLATGAAVAVTAGLTFLFAPVVSTLWWRQLNLIVLGLAVLGFVQIRRERVITGAALIGCSIALKPLLIGVPLGLLLRRETRRAGAVSLAWTAGLTALGQVFLAWRASDVGLLAPLRAARDVTRPTFDPRGSHACHPGNVSIQATTCRVFGASLWSGQRVVALALALGIAAVALAAVRRYDAVSSERLAVLCAVSPWFGPIRWVHYDVVLVPLLVVVVLRLSVRATPLAWAALLAGYGGLALVWSPAMVVPTTVSHWFGGTPIHDSFVLMRLTAPCSLMLLGVGCAVLRVDAEADERIAAASGEPSVATAW